MTGFSNGDVLQFRAIVTDIAGNSTTFNTSSSTVTVDQTIPTITNVTSPDADGYKKLGDTVTIRVTTSRSVNVTGTPKIALETGTIDGEATYSSGSGGTTLSFSYTVGAGELSSDLNYESTTAWL